MPLEIERAFHIPDEQATDAVLRDPWLVSLLTTPFMTTAMSSVYYDTPLRFLSARKWALRIRRENERSVAAFKTTGGDPGIRNEWQCTASNLDEAVQCLVARGAPRVLLDHSWHILCEVSFTRLSAILSVPDGLRAELALDSGTLTRNGQSVPFRVLELELLLGKRSQLDAFALACAERFGLTPQPKSKLERCLEIP